MHVTNVLVLSGGGLVRQVLDCLRGAHTSNFLVAGRLSSVFRYSPHCRGFAPFPFGEGSPDALEDLIEHIDRERGVDVILCCDSLAMLPVIKLGNRMRQRVAPLPSLSDFLTHNDKWAFRELCMACGVPTPLSLRFADKSLIDFDRVTAQLGSPFVVKPVSGEAGLGVLTVADRQDLQRLQANPYYRFAPLIAQEFVPGRDIDLSLLVSHGRIVCHAAQIVLGGVTHFVRADELLEMARRIVASTGFNGVVHFDARFDKRDGTIKFIESNPRFWASVARAKSCGLNFVTAAVDLALGQWSGGTKSIDGTQYQATPTFFRRLITGEVPVTEFRRATFRELMDGLADPITPILKRYARRCEIAEMRKQGIRP